MRAVRIRSEIALKRGHGLRRISEVHVRHTEAIERLRVFRVGLRGGLPLVLRLAVLVLVPENDALIVERRGTAASARCTRRTAAGRATTRSRSRFLTGLAREVEFLLLVVERCERVPAVGVVGFDLDGLLVVLFRLRLV